MPFFSFIIPVFNINKFLPDAVNSVLLQTYSDFEIVLVDDKSTDGSTQMCDQYALDDNRIKSIHLSRNNGPGLARNAGLTQARGQYVFFLDGDDSIADDSLNQLDEIIHEFDYPDMIHLGYREIFGRAKPEKQKKVERPETSVLFEEGFINGHLKKKRVGFRTWEFLVKRSILEQHNLQFGSARVWEDNDFTMRCIFASQRIAVSNMIFYQWRIRLSDSLTSNHAVHWQQMIQSAVAMLEYGTENTLPENQVRWILSCVNSCLYEFEAIAALVSHEDYIQHSDAFLPFIRHQNMLIDYIRDDGILKVLCDIGTPDGPILYAKSKVSLLGEIVKTIPRSRELYGFPATRKCVRLIECLEIQGYEFRGLLDNDWAKQGLIFDGYTVFSPEIIPLCYSRNNAFFILVTTSTRRTGAILADQLRAFGLTENEHFLCMGFDED